MASASHISESAIQTQFFDWLALIAPRVPAAAWVFHVPNGGKRDARTAALLQRQGVKAGVPDILLPWQSRGFVGWACELKRADGRTRPNQEKWIDYLTDQGWCCVVCRSFDEAAREFCAYLDLHPVTFGL